MQHKTPNEAQSCASVCVLSLGVTGPSGQHFPLDLAKTWKTSLALSFQISGKRVSSHTECSFYWSQLLLIYSCLCDVLWLFAVSLTERVKILQFLFIPLLQNITSISGGGPLFLLASIKFLRVISQAEGTGGEVLIPAQQYLNQKCSGLGEYPYPKLNPCLMWRHIRTPVTSLRGDKGASSPEKEINPGWKSSQQLCSYHFTVISAKTEDFSFSGIRTNSASSPYRRFLYICCKLPRKPRCSSHFTVPPSCTEKSTKATLHRSNWVCTNSHGTPTWQDPTAQKFEIPSD